MKKVIIVIAAIAAALLIAFGVVYAIQNSKRNKGIENLNGSIEQVDQDVQAVSNQIKQQGQQQAQTSMQRSDSDGYCGTISWHDDASAWEEVPISKEEFRELASESSYGNLAVLPNGQRIESIIGALTVDQLYSDAPTQSVVWFTYKGNDGEEHRSKLLIQGPVNCDEKEDLKGLINAQTKCCGQKITSCSILFGGRLCTTPPCQKIVTQPCNSQKLTPKTGCKTCNDASFGSSTHQADDPENFGVVKSTGGNKKLPPVNKFNY